MHAFYLEVAAIYRCKLNTDIYDVVYSSKYVGKYLNLIFVLLRVTAIIITRVTWHFLKLIILNISIHIRN